MFSPIMRSQENDIVSVTKVIIETHSAMKQYSNYYERKIKITAIRVHYTMGKTSKLTLDINEHPESRFPLTNSVKYRVQCTRSE